MDALPNLDLATRFGRVCRFVNVNRHSRFILGICWSGAARERGEPAVLGSWEKDAADAMSYALELSDCLQSPVLLFDRNS